jgi:hypothetical protein
LNPDLDPDTAAVGSLCCTGCAVAMMAGRIGSTQSLFQCFFRDLNPGLPSLPKHNIYISSFFFSHKNLFKSKLDINNVTKIRFFSNSMMLDSDPGLGDHG